MQAKPTLPHRYVQICSILLSLIIIMLLTIVSISTAEPQGDEKYIYLPVVLELRCGFTHHLFETELNDTFSSADGPLTAYETYRGCFFDSKDVDDVYFFRLTERSQVEIILNGIEAGHDYDLVLYDSSENSVGSSRQTGSDSERIVISETLRAQTYYIQVHNFSQSANSQPYELTARFGSSPECNILAILPDVFPQLQNEPYAHSIYGSSPENDPNFLCLAEFDMVYDGDLALLLDFVFTGENWGFWGVNLKNPESTEGYDASGFTQFCVRAKAEEAVQSFFLKMKDLDGNEVQRPIIVNHNQDWEQYCVAISEYKNQGVDITRLENVNVGFDQNTRDSKVYLDNFLFK